MKDHRVWMCSAALVAALIALGCLLGIAPVTARAQVPQQTHSLSLPPPHLGYGINVQLQNNIDPLFVPLGLEWIKLWEEYEIDPSTEMLPYQVLFVIDLESGMPSNLDEWGKEIERTARTNRGFVKAYEIGNEPNVERFWNDEPPDPGEYVQVLQIAYERIKAVDPDAIIVSAGLAPVGRIEGTCNGWSGNNCGAMDEREYARQMFLLGAGDYFDAFGYHPYGFAYEPETDARAVSNGFSFRGAEVMHDLLEHHDLGHKPVWATEFNWLREWTEDGGLPFECRSGYENTFAWMQVSGVQQANYITRAFQYADENWPWMGAMFVWNLDWHDYHYNWDCGAAHARYFSLRKHNDHTSLGTLTLAYESLAAMEKRPGYFGPRLAIESSTLDLVADVYEPGMMTTTLDVWNAGYRVLTWTATVATGMQVTPTLVITTGLQGTSLTVAVDSTGYSTGIFTGAITVTATATDVLDAPQTVPITLSVESFASKLAVEPPTLNFVANLREPGVFTDVVVPVNTGHHTFTWTASVITGMQVIGTGTLGVQMSPTLAITTGLQGMPLTVTVDSTGYSTGTFIGFISVTTTPSNVLNSPQIAPVILHVVSKSYHLYLPLTFRSMP